MIEKAEFNNLFKNEDKKIPKKEIEKINKYLSNFAKPNKDLKCFKCSEKLGGFFGTFQYGIVHGEGYCSNCEWPARAIHYDVGIIKQFTFILQYHPDKVIKTKEE